MKPNDTINSFKSEFMDLWHYKISDEPIDKTDSITSESFAAQIAEPFEAYEKHIRAIEIERRVACISVETPTDKFPTPFMQKEEDAYAREFLSDTDFKTFYGEYDEEMKKKIREYLIEMGYDKLRIEDELDFDYQPNYRFYPYHCDVFKPEHTLGFYFKRHGLLRGCLKETIDEKFNLDDGIIFGDYKDFESMEEHLDKDYITYIHGVEGWQKLRNYYQKNFLDNFEYGRSILYVNKF